MSPKGFGQGNRDGCDSGRIPHPLPRILAGKAAHGRPSVVRTPRSLQTNDPTDSATGASTRVLVQSSTLNSLLGGRRDSGAAVATSATGAFLPVELAAPALRRESPLPQTAKLVVNLGMCKVQTASRGLHVAVGMTDELLTAILHKVLSVDMLTVDGLTFWQRHHSVVTTLVRHRRTARSMVTQ